ncbi:MAG: hypothetical protein K6E93_08650 [Bacteroidales bacterium]|nr:hypothetical protein [Bacteroidales bacterium]
MRKYGLIGNPVGHSASKQLFDNKFASDGRDNYCYELYKLSDASHLHDWARQAQLNPIAYSGVVFLMALVLLLVCAVSDKIRIKSWEFLYNTLLGRIISCVEKAYNNVLERISMKF